MGVPPILVPQFRAVELSPRHSGSQTRILSGLRSSVTVRVEVEKSYIEKHTRTCINYLAFNSPRHIFDKRNWQILTWIITGTLESLQDEERMRPMMDRYCNVVWRSSDMIEIRMCFRVVVMDL